MKISNVKKTMKVWRKMPCRQPGKGCQIGAANLQKGPKKKSHRAIYLSIRLRWYFRTSMKVDSHGWITIYVKSERCVITSVNCGMYPSVAEFRCEFECRLTLNVENRGWNVFYTRVWIKLGFRFPPGPPLSKDVAKIMFLTAIYVNFLRNLLTAIIVNFNLY